MTPEQVAAMVAEAEEATEKWPFDDYTIALAAEVAHLTARVAEVTEQAKRAGDRVDATEAENETARKRITTLSKERDLLRAALETIRDGFDCDSDSHKYNTPCRCCLARAALDAKGAGTVTLPALEIDSEADAQVDRMLAKARGKAGG